MVHCDNMNDNLGGCKNFFLTVNFLKITMISTDKFYPLVECCIHIFYKGICPKVNRTKVNLNSTLQLIISSRYHLFH